MRKTLGKIAALGTISFALGCHQTTDYAILYRDLNRDGNLDAVSLEMDGFYSWKGKQHKEFSLGDTRYHVDYVFYVALGNGDGSFQPKKEVLRDHNSEYEPAILGFSLGDFNRDGKIDISYILLNAHKIIASGHGNGKFESPKEID